MVGIALDGRPIGGVIHKPFLDISNSTSEYPEYDKVEIDEDCFLLCYYITTEMKSVKGKFFVVIMVAKAV